jgi:hypothetical protein
MKLKLIIFFALPIHFSSICFCQAIDTACLNSLKNTHDLPYKDKDGRLLGCGQSLECSPMKVVVYRANLNKAEKTLEIHGRVIDPSIINDTDGVICYIFLTQTADSVLNKIRPLPRSYERLKNDIHKDEFPYRSGDFVIKCKFGTKDKLIFDSPFCRPIEYRIGELLSGG